MIRLFRSSLYRALKSKIFFACLIVNAAVALIGCLYQAYSLRPSGYEVSALGIFYSGFGGGMSLIGILSALTVSIFVGTEFTSGAMRNKVIVGSGRAKLYWCNLVTACALCVLIYAGYHLVNFTLGTALLGWGGGASAATVAGDFFAGVLMTCAYASIFTAVVMISRSSMTGIIVGIVGTLVVLFMVQMILGGLAGHYVHDPNDPDGAIFVPCQWPAFLQYAAKFAVRLFPSGQAVLLQSGDAVLWQLMPLSALWIVLSASLGAWTFGKMDLK